MSEAPERVVSMNLCTDQLAMLLAAPGQLISISHLASDPFSSSMVAEAQAYPVNRGQAEQVFLMRPDLVLAGTYTAQATVRLLQDLGVPVVQVPPVESLAEGAAQIRQIGAALGQDARAEAMAVEFEAGVAALHYDGPRATAAFYYPNGYTSSAESLSSEVIARAGFDNIAAEIGVSTSGKLSLEDLVMAAPDVIITSDQYPGYSNAEALFDHPALTVIRAQAGAEVVSNADWGCGTPHILRALAQMVALHDRLAVR
jgi:iron complex transport system substrate-binding protein